MRLIAAVAISLLFACPALAAGDSSSWLSQCFSKFRAACVAVEYQPKAESFCHETPTPITPCLELGCPQIACHKPLVACTPRIEVCMQVSCHKPVVTLVPKRGCTCKPPVTGTLDRDKVRCQDCS